MNDQIPVWRNKPVIKLTKATVLTSGRNNLGHITVQHRGGGSSRRFRIIDLRRSLHGVPAVIMRIERDPFRTAPIALLCYSNGVLSYILAARGLHSFRYVYSGYRVPIEPSNCLLLHNIPIGTYIHNIEPRRGLGGVLIRTGGSKAQILKKTENFSIIRFPSRRIKIYTFFSLGNYRYNLKPYSLSFKTS